MTTVVRAQDDTGRSQSLITSFAPTQGDTGSQSLDQPEVTPITQTASAIAEAYTPDIQALAGNLGNDATRIFNYVHDQIRYVHYFGSKKGAELTLLERSGNDFDQCALLVALLRAAGYANVQYQFGWLKMPYDSSNHQDLHHWLALNLINTNWSTTFNFLGYFFGSRGYYYGEPVSGDTNDLVFQRIWVTLPIGGTTYYLDPSFKVSEATNGINLASGMGFSSSTMMTNTLWTNAGGTDAGSSVSNLSESSLRGALQTCNSNFLGYLSNNMPDATVAQVIGGQQIVSSSGLPLRTNLAFTNYTGSSYPLQNWTNQPTNFMGTFSISFDGTNQTWYTPELEGQRVSLTFSNNGVARLWLEDTPVLQVNNTSPSNTVNVILSATHPYGGWNTTSNFPVDTGVSDQRSTNAYQTTNASYAIMYAFEANPAWLTERQQKLDAYLAAGYTNGSRQVTTETLNVMGLGWMVQTELAHELLCQEWGQLPENQHRFGRMGQEAGSGYYIDVYMQLDGTFSSTGYYSPDIANNEEFDVSSYFWSAMEHGIIEQLQNSNLLAASTVKMIEIASTNSQAVYLASSANWNSVKGHLTGYNSTTSNTLNSLISSGYTLLLPQNGSNNVEGPNTWAGEGYVKLGVAANGQRTMGMMIGGGYNGGFSPNKNDTVNTPVTVQNGDLQSTFFNRYSATLPVQLGADPVNMVDGSFQITSTDLSVGQTEPRGLNLTRYYSSERIHSNPAGMAPGWLHSYYCNATPISDPEGGLGTATVEQMAPMIVATCAALNLYNNTGTLDAKNWTVTALIAKWGIDQLINNAVSVNMGNATVQFIKQPNGSYTPQANCTMSLIPTNGAYWLQERHGRTFKFGTNNLLTNIVDPYGQSMKLSYNSNNLVTNVTDWTNRSLTFGYSGTPLQLTSVSDSAGRSVSYGYTGADLTSYADPEQKTNSYVYDTNHQIISTLDALQRLVVTNMYDGFGHITTQLTQDDTNKTWQVYASGYETVEIDPAGDELVYTYDNKSRLIAFQDGMGNVTQTFYDGQDHVIQTISPLGETNQFIYDGNNNLIETIDPLGYSNVFSYDSNNNLIASTDARGNTNHFGYNAQFSLIGQTNGNGDWTVFAFNSNGTLHSRQDSAGTTSYGYDTTGTLASISYPSPLGSESFGNNTLGDPTSHTDGNSNQTSFAYNNRRQLTSTVAPTNLTASISYDANGNVFTTTDARNFTTTNTWSVTRHLLATAFPGTPQGAPIITNSYDSRDWLASTQNPLGNTTYYTNDAAHRLIASTDPLNRTTTFAYDADSHQTNATDAASERTAQFWNARGNLVKVIDTANNSVARAYDGAGNLIYLTNRNGNVWRFQYDGANRLTNTISPLGHGVTNSYNNRGLLAATTNALGQATLFGYDARARMTSKADGTGTTTYQFDLDSNLTNITENGQSLQQSFDAYNRLIKCTDVNGYIMQYRRDANGNVTNLIYPGNRTINYYYDSNNRLTNVTDWASKQTSYTYDLAGHVTSITRPNNTLRTMAYDADGELTNIVERTTDQFPIAFFTLNWSNSGRVQWEFKGPLPHPYTPPGRTNTFDADNRLLTFNSTGVTVDFNGNLTYGPGTNNSFINYAYDARNRLTNAAGISYGYDPAENRTSLTNGTNIAVYVIDPKTSQVLMRIKGGITNYYVYGTGLLYESDEAATNSTTAFYHYDCRGSTVTLTDGYGNPTDLIEYSPYGTTTYRAGTNDTPFLYNGQFGVQTDPNGLLYMRARYYNPYISRFLNPDPNGFSSGLNFYVFGNGNPISNEDPFGLEPGYGNPVSGPSGPIGPSSPFVPGGVFYIPTPSVPANYTAPNPTGMGTILADTGASYYAGFGGGGGTQIIQLANGQIVTYGYAQIGSGFGGVGGYAEGGKVYNVYQATDYEGAFSSVSGGLAYGNVGVGGSISGQPLPRENGAASVTVGASTLGVSGSLQYYGIIGATAPTVSSTGNTSGSQSGWVNNGAGLLLPLPSSQSSSSSTGK